MRDANARSARRAAGSGGAGGAGSLPLARGLLSWGGAQRGAAVAPHVAGAAVDLTLVDSAGRELDLGTPVDATPEQSEGACYFGAPQVSSHARADRELLARVLRGAGLVNYRTEWWHWSYGDRYWALVTGAPAALYGPVAADRAAR